MSRAWYRKYRPNSIEDYVGSIPSINRFKAKDKPNIVLLCGTTGCGKTTLARILCKYYQCEEPLEDGSPCNSCATCVAINEDLVYKEDTGNDVEGITEVDGGSLNGKEAISNVIDSVSREAPLYSNYSIVILDESQQLTQAAQSLLLKTTEDCPKHLVIIYATTDPEKLMGTLRTRCQVTIEVKSKNIDEMVSILLNICKKEELVCNIEALRVIAKIGIPRMCINMLEDVARSNEGCVTLEAVNKFMNKIDQELYYEFYEVAHSGNPAYILEYLEGMKEKNIEAVDFMNGLVEFTLEAMNIRHGVRINEYTKEKVDRVKSLFKMYGTATQFEKLIFTIEYAIQSANRGIGNYGRLLIVNMALKIGEIYGIGDTNGDVNKENNEGTKLYGSNNKLSSGEIGVADEIEGEGVVDGVKLDIQDIDGESRRLEVDYLSDLVGEFLSNRE